MADITIPGEAKEAANKIEYLMRLHDDMSDTIEALRAENERLRAALGEIAAMSSSNTCGCEMCIAARVARAALEEK